MTEKQATAEGFIPFRGYRTWYSVTGRQESERWPILVVHGGPALPHDYLEPLASLAGTGHQVVFYDQLGCGNSDRPSDPALWTEQLFVEELQTVRQALGLRRFHLYAHSYGGVPALNYALTQPKELVSLILANCFPGVPALLSGWKQLLASMPGPLAEEILEYEENGVISGADYPQHFQSYFIERHVCRVPMPECVKRAFRKDGKPVHLAMHGPRWFKNTGHYRNWDVANRLMDIQVPTLILSGRHDVVAPDLAEALHRGITGSELHIFEEGSHLPFIEAPEEHDLVVNQFLGRVEASLGNPHAHIEETA